MSETVRRQDCRKCGHAVVALADVLRMSADIMDAEIKEPHEVGPVTCAKKQWFGLRDNPTFYRSVTEFMARPRSQAIGCAYYDGPPVFIDPRDSAERNR